MNPLFVVIAAAGHDAEALLAAEALRHAAGQRPLAVEARQRRRDRAACGRCGRAGRAIADRGDAGTHDDADTAADASRFVQATVERCSLREALDDPAGACTLRCRQSRSTAHGREPGQAHGQADRGRHLLPHGHRPYLHGGRGAAARAAALGHAMRVETQGSVGALDALTPQEIAEADLVIIAADREVDLSRFAGKPLLRSGTKPAIRDGSGLIAKALAEAAVHGVAVGAAAAGGAAPTPARTQGGAYRHLMTGVSFMLPFVTAGGILIAMAFALGGIYVHDDAHQGTLGWTLFQIGAKGGFALMVPALAGYIAYSIADRPGIAPGMIGGMIASSMGRDSSAALRPASLQATAWPSWRRTSRRRRSRPAAHAHPARAGQPVHGAADVLSGRCARGRAAAVAERLAARHAGRQCLAAGPVAGRDDGL